MKIRSLFDEEVKKLIVDNPEEYLKIIDEDIIYIIKKCKYGFRKKLWKSRLMVCTIQKSAVLTIVEKYHEANKLLEEIYYLFDFDIKEKQKNIFYWLYLMSKFSICIETATYEDAKILLERMIENLEIQIEGEKKINSKIIIDINKCILEYYLGDKEKCIKMLNNCLNNVINEEQKGPIYYYLCKCYLDTTDLDTFNLDIAKNKITQLLNKCENRQCKKKINDLLNNISVIISDRIFWDKIKNNKLLSKNSREMLQCGKKVVALNNREEIILAFKEKNIPIFENVVEFQKKYGGIWYKIGENYYEGYRLDMFYYNDFHDKYELRYFTKEDGVYYFQCMDYHYAGDIGPCIDQFGKIYNFGMGSFFIRADSIEEFLDDEAIKYYIENQKLEYINRKISREEIDEFIKRNHLFKIEKETFTGKYFEWWKNTEESIFIRIDLLSKYNFVSGFCKDQCELN